MHATSGPSSLGLSAVTAPIGIESDREAKHNGSSSVLFRFSPELAFRPTASRNFELVYRIHHRSGLYGTIGGLKEGSNAHVFGLRWFRWNHGGSRLVTGAQEPAICCRHELDRVPQ